ncbi:hypothetical protein M2149_002786, partial [Lachnospiraceae bacterium PFB1-21]
LIGRGHDQKWIGFKMNRMINCFLYAGFEGIIPYASHVSV